MIIHWWKHIWWTLSSISADRSSVNPTNWTLHSWQAYYYLCAGNWKFYFNFTFVFFCFFSLSVWVVCRNAYSPNAFWVCFICICLCSFCPHILPSLTVTATFISLFSSTTALNRLSPTIYSMQVFKSKNRCPSLWPVCLSHPPYVYFQSSVHVCVCVCVRACIAVHCVM